MADSKTTALTELTTFSGNETFYVVEDDDGTPASRRVTVENVAVGLAAQAGMAASYGMLAYTEYDPASDTPTTSNSSTGSDVDATNLSVTFTVPPSGKVIVRMSAMASANNASEYYLWGLRESSSDVAASYVGITLQVAGRRQYTRRFTGLTPAASHTWKWAHKVGSAATTGTIRYGGLPGAAVMEVWPAL